MIGLPLQEPTPTIMIAELEKRLGHEELRKRLDALRRGPDGFIRMRTLLAIGQLYQELFPTSNT